MATVAEGDVSVMLSSHLIGELERICDFLVVLTGGQVTLEGTTSELLAEHRRVVGAPRDTAGQAQTHEVIQAQTGERQCTLILRGNMPIHNPRLQISDVGLEDLVLAYLGRPVTQPPPFLAFVGESP